MVTTPPKTAPEVLTDVGRTLFDTQDWQARLASALGVSRSSIQFWRNQKMRLPPNHPVFKRLLELVEERANELTKSRDELREWLNAQKERQP